MSGRDARVAMTADEAIALYREERAKRVDRMAPSIAAARQEFDRQTAPSKKEQSARTRHANARKVGTSERYQRSQFEEMTCACGCGRRFTPRSGHAKYAPECRRPTSAKREVA